MLSELRRFKEEAGNLFRFQRLAQAERDIVIYSESESYWPYFAPIVESIVREHDRTVIYLTSSATDPLLTETNAGIKAFYIGSGTIRTIAFATLEANLLVMTTPDLQTGYIKRSKFPVHYVFLPHNMNSTHMVFRKMAHNGFDTVFCVGPHQAAELREAEKIYDLKPRSLPGGGYVRLDSIIDRAMQLPPPTTGGPRKVLVAPTWGEQALINYGCEPLLDSLLDAGFQVVVRPHRDSEVGDAETLARLDDKYRGHPRFEWAKNLSETDAFYSADILITDWSGAALSFAFGLLRPVVSIDVPAKINNADFRRFSSVPFEVSIRDQLGAVLDPRDMASCPTLLNALLDDRAVIGDRLASLRDKWVYRHGDAAAFAANHIVRLADERRQQMKDFFD